MDKVKELTPELRVFGFIKDLTLTPLHFTEETKKPNDDLTDLIMYIITTEETRCSLNKKDEIDTGAGKWRSVLDIWRHVTYHRPKSTIFAVMRTMYELDESSDGALLCGQFCRTVHRRTFKARKLIPWNDLHDKEVLDEFELLWDDWKEIGRHYKYTGFMKRLKLVREESAK